MQLEITPGTKKHFVRNKAISLRDREPAALSIYAPLRRFLYEAGDTRILARIPLPRKSLWTQQKIVDCKVGLCTSLWTVAELLQQYSA